MDKQGAVEAPGSQCVWPVPQTEPLTFYGDELLIINNNTLFEAHLSYLRVTSVLCSEVAPGGARGPYVVLGIVSRSAAYKART